MSKRKRAWFMVGIALILLLAISIPSYRAVILKSRESTLEVNLASMRSVIRQYTNDYRRAPRSLQDLVVAGYFRQLPMDPMTNSNSSWQVVTSQQGITDVHSDSSSISSKGTAYNSW